MADPDFDFKINLDDREFFQRLKKLRQETEELAKRANTSFKSVDTTVQETNKTLGKTIGIASALTTKIIDLGAKAFRFLAQQISESVEAAQVQLKAEGQLQAAIRSTGNATGLTAQQLKDMASALQSITNYGDEATIGAEALLLTFKSIGGETFPRALKAILDVSTAMDQDLKISTIQVGKALNDPISGLTNLRRVGIQFTEAQEEQIKTLTKAGDLIGAQTIILAELESQFGGSAEAARKASGGFEAAQNAIGDLKEAIGIELLPSVEVYNEAVIKAAEGWKVGIENIGLLRDAIQEVTGVAGTPVEEVKGLEAVLLLATDPVAALGEGFRRIQVALEQGITPAANDFAQFIVESTVGLDEFGKALEAANQKRQAVDEVPFVPPVDDIVPDELPDEVKKALDKISELERDAARDRIDILRKAGQKTVDTEEEFIQKRIDQALKFLREIEDIERKNAQAIEDSGTDLHRDQEDAQTDYNRNLIALEKETAKNRIKIEEDYRDEIRKIQANFEFDLEEAARNRDSVTYQRLLRQRDKQIDEARTTRDKRLSENDAENEDKRAQLQQELQYELEDAKLADDRRLEDLRVRLERELEEARLKNSRELDDLTTNEERKRAELKSSLDRQLEEARLANDRRVADYKESLDEEIKALVEAEEKKTQILRDAIAKRNELQKRIDEIKDREAGEGHTSRLGGRQFGGPVGAGQTVMVGERGPEPFRPSIAGTILPASPSITSPLLGGGGISNSFVTNATVNQSMLDPSQQSALMRAIARNEAVSVMQRLING